MTTPLRRVAAVLAVGTAGGAMGIGAGLAWSTAALTYLALGQVVLVVSVVSIIRLLEGRLDPFHPILLIALVFPLMYTAQIFILTSGQDRLISALAPWLRSQQDAQRQAAALATAGLACLLGGYVVATRLVALREGDHGQRRSGRRPPGWRTRATAIAVLGLNLFIAFLITIGGPGALIANLYNRTVFFEGLNYLANGPLLVAAVVGALLTKGAWPPSKGTLLLAGGVLALAAATGSKSTITVAVILWTCLIHERHRRVTWKQVTVVLILMPLVLAMYDLYFRDALPRGVPLTQVVTERGGVSGALSQLSDDALFGHQALTLAVTVFPSSHAYTGWQSLTSVLVAPIPRSVLSSKPDAPSGTFTDAIARQFHASGSTIPPTAFGEMYMSAGVLGLVVGAFSLGLFAGIVYRSRVHGDGHLVASAVLSASILAYMRGETYGVLVVDLMIAVPMLWIVFGRGAAVEEPNPHVPGLVLVK